MALKLSGSDYVGTGGVRLEEPGTYECTLTGASAYRNNLYQSEDTRPELTLIWDTGLVAEKDDGEEAPVLIYDSYLNISRNDGRIDVAGITLNGEALFGKTALVSVVINDKGYPKVTSVSAPLRKAASKYKQRETEAPEGIPT